MKDVPADYFQRIHDVEHRHWWHRGMLEITWALLGDRAEGRVLDAGCGTGGFLRSLLDRTRVEAAAGVDFDPGALELAKAQVPEAELRLGSVAELPFGDASFDLVVLNDVLQHVAEDEVERGVGELRRVLRPGGRLLIRTNAARNARRERDDWRIYDEATLARVLGGAGFRCDRLTHANLAGSLWAALLRRTPRAPTERSCGVPSGDSRLAATVGFATLRAEAAYLQKPGRRLPYGHTLFALAAPTAEPGGSTGHFRRTHGQSPYVLKTAPQAVPSGAGVSDAASLFDAEAGRYDAAYDAPGWAGRALRARLAAVVDLVGPGPGRLLDAGAGPGRLCAELERLGWETSGVDLSEEMVAAARARVPEAAERFVRAPIEALPFPDGSFDVVVATGVLEYAADLERALGELARVLVPGGRAVLSFPNYRSVAAVWRRGLLYPLARAFRRRVPGRRPPPLKPRRPLRRQELERLVAAAGLRVEQVRPVAFAPSSLEGHAVAGGLLARQFVLLASRRA